MAANVPRRQFIKGATAAVAATAAAQALPASTANADPGGGQGKGHVEPTVKSPLTTNTGPGIDQYFDPSYNVVRGRVPESYHPWVANREDRILLYTRTAGPRHAHLGPALKAGINPALTPQNVLQNAMIKWMGEVGVQVDWTEDVSRLASISSSYKAVVFASTSRDVMWKHGTAVAPASAVDTTTGAHLDAAKTALRQYVRAGGGFVGIHNAFGTEYNWPWYEGLLGGANYYDHGNHQNGDVVVVNSDSSTDRIPKRWAFRDEWYNLVPFPTRVKFLLTVDESTVATKSRTHPGHGDFHPVSWCQYYDGGRAFLTTLGHDSDAWRDGSGYPSQEFFKQHIVKGVLSAMGTVPFCS
ncbi:ThuA domain-containing protein [Dactylosporangium sp. NPDC000244]|uniref:ThuA domain-containing protein n=1 Tax=Dactylosporangium sp. NPDC000244 TaxID=3154365 RepID=UPI00332D7A41